ncbi:solute carrier family 26 member 6-like, partial [Brachionus plicatilis]
LYLRLFQNIESINWAAFIFSIVCIVFLYLTRTQINERFKTQLKNIPLPIELFVIIVGTVISNLAELNKNYAMTVVGSIPKGFPEPQLPEFNLFMDMLLDAVILSVIAYATSLSVSDLFARKHKYKIDSNKEFFALGASNIAGSFFQSFVSCGSLSRTVVADSSGGKTQLVTIIASSVVLTVMLWLGPFLEQLPKACLGSIIVAALLNLLLQVRDLPYYWRLDRLDFATWIITFISTIILDVDFGLCIGFLTVLFLNTYRTQKLEVKVQGRVKDFELYRQVDKYLVTEQESIRVVCPNQSIYFVTSDIFKNQLNYSCPSKSNMITDLSLLENCKINYGCGNGGTENSDIEIRIDDTENDTLNNSKKFETIIINFTNVQFVDEAGCKCLKEIIKDYESDNIQILFACCNGK